MSWYCHMSLHNKIQSFGFRVFSRWWAILTSQPIQRRTSHLLFVPKYETHSLKVIREHRWAHAFLEGHVSDAFSPFITVTGSSIWGLSRLIPITVAKFSTFILFTLECSCTSNKKLPNEKRHDQHQIQVRLVSGGLCVIWMYSKVLKDIVGLSNYGTPSLECPIMLCVPASTHRQT